MNPPRYFRWISSEQESANLQSQGARIVEKSAEMHHANYGILHELPPDIAESIIGSRARRVA